MLHNSLPLPGCDPLNVAQIRRKNIEPLLAALSKDKRVVVEEIGRSYQNRSINAITLGQGDIRLMAWTQMHGDEPTATAAVFDMLSLLLADKGPFNFDTFKQSFTLKVIPMLNPDGAEAETRINAQGIDINRDARLLNTPEGRVLFEAAKTFQPHVGFNLHDQSPFYSAGDTTNHATMAFLAPAFNEEKNIDAARHRAMQLIALMRKAISNQIPDSIARYDDAFGAHCFGDNLAGLGISTILIESGEHPNDPNRQIARKLNVIALFTAMQALMDSSYKAVSLDDYFALPQNVKEGLIAQRKQAPCRALMPTANDDKPGWMERHQQKRAEAAKVSGSVQWVFIGDSITQAWERHTINAFNLGFNGDRTEHVLWRIQNGALDGLSPQGVLLMIGTNNTGHHFDDPEETATAIAEIADLIHQQLPSAKVVIHAILPAGRNNEDKKRQRNYQVNRMIRWLRHRPYVEWLDLTHLFVDNEGRIPESVMEDALHPTDAQYRVWAEALKPELMRLAPDASV
ncbi:hypothetical protein DRW07_04515 [Alteromonas sediminis]|uniref:Peptidase M14 n=1 Tax=Alteromonas sediminis TaxID=2259342 RepID=A0A3N5YFA0_9ALTE|nr:GDSL-type esterase/lipase family protein [Alteromonas sediminis]RPJ68665.1 hypothetical protein DRW07_04515 [Alteromonas sediminis]